VSAWLYAYLLQHPDNSGLRAKHALQALRAERLTIAPAVTEVVCDAEGHCEPGGRRFSLSGEGFEQVGAIGRNAEVVRNPETGEIVSVNPTSTKKAERLLRRLEDQ
jgi:hypothetical protein